MILEQLCLWTSSNPPLDYFLHLGGDPMIILGDILACDDVQQTISQLLTHVGSPSHHSITSRMSSHCSSHHHSLLSCGSQSSSHGSLTGTHVIISDPLQSDLPPAIPSSPSFETLASTPCSHSLPLSLDPATLNSKSPSPVVDPSTSLDLPTSLVHNPDNSLPTPVAHPASCSSHFPNIDISDLHSSNQHFNIFHGCHGTPTQTSISKSSFPDPLVQQPSAASSLPVGAPWDQYANSRSAFVHRPTSHQQVLCTHALATPPMCSTGAHWTHFILDPTNTHPIVDPLTNSIPPW